MSLVMTAAVLLTACSDEEEKFPVSSDCDILAFKTGSDVWTIEGTNITYLYPASKTAVNQRAFITTSAWAKIDPSPVVVQNFFTEEGVTYTVTAQDGVSKKTYIAKATIEIDAPKYLGEAYPDGVPHEPGRVEAEDFDKGGEGIAFHDNDETNNAPGTPYRTNAEDNPVDVQIGVGTSSNDHGIGWGGDGEWLNYSINAPEAGLYKFTFRTANDYNTSFDLKVDDLTVATVTVPTDWWGGSNTDVPDVALSAGVHVITIYMNNGFFFDYFEFVKQ
ncbi:hypothetical protein FACS189413_17350 [Bacteroidia bacterium]|nr:hypothetical protein FACS189463_3050 [Bacteroidia bacterium]GHU73222.1 hypothetical protein FACS189413_17350 [Bacteroidia bacterium]